MTNSKMQMEAKRTMYDVPLSGISLFSDNLVTIIGEQTVFQNGKFVDQYLYTIDGYTPENGLPFVALKGNLIVLDK